MHPDSPSGQCEPGCPELLRRQDGDLEQWVHDWRRRLERANAMDPDFRMRALAPFSPDGKIKPVHHLGPGTALLTVLKKPKPIA